jgi:hypothetical protein
MCVKVAARETRLLEQKQHERVLGAPYRIDIEQRRRGEQEFEANLLIQVKAPSARAGHCPLEGLQVFAVLATDNASHRKPRRIQC